jgi:hypothetical protein
MLLLTLAVTLLLHSNIFQPRGATAPRGTAPPANRGFTIILRYTTLGRISLDEWSARRRDLYLTKHNTHKRQTAMFPAGFEPTIPAMERPQTHGLDRAATGNGPIVSRKAELNFVKARECKHSAESGTSLNSLNLEITPASWRDAVTLTQPSQPSSCIYST